MTSFFCWFYLRFTEFISRWTKLKFYLKEIQITEHSMNYRKMLVRKRINVSDSTYVWESSMWQYWIRFEEVSSWYASCLFLVLVQSPPPRSKFNYEKVFVFPLEVKLFFCSGYSPWFYVFVWCSESKLKLALTSYWGKKNREGTPKRHFTNFQQYQLSIILEREEEMVGRRYSSIRNEWPQNFSHGSIGN